MGSQVKAASYITFGRRENKCTMLYCSACCFHSYTVQITYQQLIYQSPIDMSPGQPNVDNLSTILSYYVTLGCVTLKIKANHRSGPSTVHLYSIFGQPYTFIKTSSREVFWRQWWRKRTEALCSYSAILRKKVPSMRKNHLWAGILKQECVKCCLLGLSTFCVVDIVLGSTVQALWVQLGRSGKEASNHSTIWWMLNVLPSHLLQSQAFSFGKHCRGHRNI